VISSIVMTSMGGENDEGSHGRGGVLVESGSMP
jgi:hypothetical protein